HAWTREHPPDVPGLRTHSAVVDGPDAVRRAAREQMRRGATQVKLHVSGGIMSPSDPLESLQFTVDEIRAAVEEAEAFGRYVVVHAHTSPAMQRALDAGVRSIEHGSILDEATAKRIAAGGVYLGPTLVILEILARSDRLPAFARQKLDLVREESRRSVKLAQASGVKLTSGSDLLGPRQSRRASEIAEKAKHIGAMEAILSATRTNAELFRMQDRIGTVEQGKDADLILVAGDPLADVGVLVDAANIRLVLKSGVVVKDLT
ncbi:MAG TPA: amidohydrolase family protein, partial [Dehalococcoidia bacterium]|nr:amidohydrolase family protein [Dehalococcoidia bacterium]